IDANTMAAGTISGNTIQNCGSNGLDLYKSAPSISANVIMQNQRGVVVSGDTSFPTINYNDIVGNTLMGVTNSSGNMIDARYNWWGSLTGPGPVGPGFGDKVSLNVNYSPCLGAPNNRYYRGEAGISGHVYRDANDNGQYDAGEGVAGVRVSTANGYQAEALSTADGSFSMSGIPGNMGYVVYAEKFGFDLGVRSDIWVNALNQTQVNIPVTQIDVSTLTVEELRPNPNDYDQNGTEDALVLMKGGTGYRYYQVRNAQGKGVNQCPCRVVRSDSVVITNGITANYQGLDGIAAIAIPESALSVGSSSGNVSLIVSHLNGVELPAIKKKTFVVQVRPREYETRWESELSGSISGHIVGGLKVEAATDYTIVLSEKDGNVSRPESLTFERGAEAGVGVKVEKSIVKAGAKVGPLSVDAGVGASLEGLIGIMGGDEHEFSYQSGSLDESMAKAYLLCFPALGFATGGQPILASCLVALEGIVNLPPYKQEGSAGLYMTGAGKVWAGATADAGAFLGNSRVGLGGNLTGKVRAEGEVIVRPPTNEIAIAARYDCLVRFNGILGAYSNPGKEYKLVGGLKFQGDLLVSGGEYEVAWDASSGIIREGRIKSVFGETNPGDLFVDHNVERTWRFRGASADLNTLFVEAPTFAALTAAKVGITGPGVVFQSETMLDDFYALSERMESSASRVWAEVEDESLRLNNRISPVFGVEGSLLGVGGSVSIGAEFADKKKYTTRKASLLVGREFVTGVYTNDAFTPNATVQLADIYAETWAQIGWEGLMTYAASTAVAGVQFAVNTSIGIGQGALTLAADSVAAGTDVINNAWQSAWSWLPPPRTTLGTGGVGNTLLSDGTTNNWRFGIGGFYDLKPSGLALSPPGTLAISYADSEVAGIPEDTLAMYQWNTNSLLWEYKGGTRNLAGNVVSNQINVLALYTLAPRMPYGAYVLTPSPSSVTNNGVSTVVFTSDVMSNNDTTAVSNGQLFTVSASLGDIITADADASITGKQVAVVSGRISFTVQTSIAGTGIVANAQSVIGAACADGRVSYVSSGAPPAPSNVQALVDGTAIKVSWAPITNANVVSYAVHYDSDNASEPFEGKAALIGCDSPIEVGNVTNYRLFGLESNSTYYIVVKARNAFGVEGPASSYASVLNTAPVDSDADGLPDWWEALHASGSNGIAGLSLAHHDALLDNDGDGQSNMDELRAGTSPIDPHSVFRFTSAQKIVASNGIFVSWPGVTGRQYQLLRTSSLTNPWATVGSPIAGSNGTMGVYVPATSSPSLFIRVNLQ
ncbi:MAG: hypothetical protein EOM72_04140, partial [Opitutae bacterium]|nr:hypothetical protein [Opitutae bacterium]